MHGLVSFLFVMFFATLWLRDHECRKLCKAADSFMKEGVADTEWRATYEKALLSTAERHRIAIIGKNLEALPAKLQQEYKKYRFLRIIPFVVFCAIVVLGIVSSLLR